MERLKIAVLGYGYWGKNLTRVFSQSDEFELTAIVDANPASLEKAHKLYPSAKLYQSHRELKDSVEAVAIVTPAATHYELAKEFLDQGKHVLVTKPLTQTYGQSVELFALAEKNDVSLFVDHTFVFNPAVRKLKEFLPKIGDPYFAISQRLNLGLYQNDVNVIYDLMPHDISIFCYLFDEPAVRANTSAYAAAGLAQQDLAHSSFETQSGIKGLITVSWLSPMKIRQFVLVGSKGMLLYDDNEVAEKIRFFDKGISVESLQSLSQKEAEYTRISYRNGDLFSPAIPNTEALAFESQEFASTIRNRNARKPYETLNLNIMKSLELILNSHQPA